MQMPWVRTGRRFTPLAALALWAATAVAAAACPAPPAVVRDLEIPRYYDDAAGSRIDPVLKARNDAAVAPLVAFLRHVTAEADAALKSAKTDKRQAAAACALTWLEHWARGKAWLGRVDQQGEYQRKWDLGGAALAYVKVKSHATLAQRQAIEGWLQQVATEARAFFDHAQRKRNNHWYWLGLALGGVALATDDQRWWGEARRIAADAARDIRPDGALAMELERGQRALHYHAFAAMPLVVLAEIAAARGEDFYGLNNGALHRLITLTLAGLAEPASFQRLAGVSQSLSPSSAGAGWLPLYQRRFPARVTGALPPMRTSDRRLGGDVVLLLPGLGVLPGR